MDELYELIDSRIKKIQDNTALHAVPCMILSQDNFGNVEVQPIGSNVTYKALNYSGIDLKYGDNAILFYTGNILSNNGYIGASYYRSDSHIRAWQAHVGDLSNGDGACALAFLEVEKATNIICTFDAVLEGGSTEGDICLQLYVDDLPQGWPALHTLHSSEHQSITTSQVITLTQGVHEIYLYATGVGKVKYGRGNFVGWGFHSPSTPQTPTVPFLR